MELQFFNETLRAEPDHTYPNIVRYYTSLGKDELIIQFNREYKFYIDHLYIGSVKDFNPCEIYRKIQYYNTIECQKFLKYYKEQYEKYSIFE